MSDELVERIRSLKPMADLVLPPSFYNLLEECAVEIERLRKELQQMRREKMYFSDRCQELERKLID